MSRTCLQAGSNLWYYDIIKLFMAGSRHTLCTHAKVTAIIANIIVTDFHTISNCTLVILVIEHSTEMMFTICMFLEALQDSNSTRFDICSLYCKSTLPLSHTATGKCMLNEIFFAVTQIIYRYPHRYPFGYSVQLLTGSHTTNIRESIGSDSVAWWNAFNNQSTMTIKKRNINTTGSQPANFNAK